MISLVVGLAIVLDTYQGLGLGQQVSVYAQVDRWQNIYAGQRFTYQIVIDGYNQPGQVDLTTLDRFRPMPMGNQDLSQISIQVINGRTYQQSTIRLVMNYSLIVEQPGHVTIPPVDVTIEGRTYRTNPVEIDVLAPGTTDKLALEVLISDPNCYVGQPVILTVRLFIAQDAEVGGLEFEIPALLDQRLIRDDPQDIPAHARPAKVYGNVTAYVWQEQVQYKGRPWNCVAFKKVLIPQQPGLLDLGQCTASVALATGVQAPSSIFDSFGFFGARTRYDRFGLFSGPLVLNARPLPQTGRPDGFYGLVGAYRISATASPTEVCVGDPITLTITITGPYLAPVQWPQLEAIPEMAQNFKIPSERAWPTVSNGQKVFTQTLRATSEQVTMIPSIRLPYFDPVSGSYQVAKTEPIPLKVMPTRVLTSKDVGTASAGPPRSSQIEAIRQGLAANYDGPDALVDCRQPGIAAFVRPAYLATWAGPLTIMLFSLGLKLARQASPTIRAASRKRRAAARAVKELRRAAATKDLGAATDALKRYVADRFDRKAGALTPADCHQIVLQSTNSPDLAGRFHTLMSQLDATRYGSQGSDAIAQDWLDRAIETIERIDRAIR